MRIKRFLDLLKETIRSWLSDHAGQAAGALAFFTLFSLAPLLIIAIGIAGIIFGSEAAQQELLDQIRFLAGEQAANLAGGAIEKFGGARKGIWGTVIGTVTLLFGATTVFAQMQSALNRMWNVEVKPGKPVRGFFRKRLISFGMVLIIGILLVALLLSSAFLSAMGDYIKEYLGRVNLIIRLSDIGISIVIATVLFALIFKFLPDARIRWRDLWAGALLTSFLFTLAKFLIGLYFSRTTIVNAYGAAGSLVVLLIWVYFSAQILFLGAEFTQVYARKYGEGIHPSGYARHTDEQRPPGKHAHSGHQD